MIELNKFEMEVLNTCLTNPQKINKLPEHLYDFMLDYLSQEMRYADMFHMTFVKAKCVRGIVETEEIIRYKPWTIDEVFDKYKEVIENEADYDDYQLADQIRAIHECAIPTGFYVCSVELDKIIQRRVLNYCEREDIWGSDYDGPLPYRKD
jgi:hypothetical protein